MRAYIGHIDEFTITVSEYITGIFPFPEFADGSNSPAPADGFAGVGGKRLCAGFGGVGPADRHDTRVHTTLHTTLHNTCFHFCLHKHLQTPEQIFERSPLDVCVLCDEVPAIDETSWIMSANCFEDVSFVESILNEQDSSQD